MGLAVILSALFLTSDSLTYQSMETTRLKPISSGTHTEIQSNSWTLVDEYPMEHDVISISGVGWKKQTYEMEDISSTSSKRIQSVELVTVCKIKNPQLTEVTKEYGIKGVLVLDGETKYTSEYDKEKSGWQSYSTTFTKNPFTNNEWQWGEINQLEAGISLKILDEQIQSASLEPTPVNGMVLINGLPKSNIPVIINVNSESQSTVTNEGGFYSTTFFDIDTGQTVQITAEYNDETYSNQISYEDGKWLNLHISSDEPVELDSPIECTQIYLNVHTEDIIDEPPEESADDQTYELLVTSNPQGATAKITNIETREQKYQPTGIEVELNSGEYEIICYKEGYNSENQQITLNEDKTLSFTLNEQPKQEETEQEQEEQNEEETEQNSQDGEEEEIHENISEEVKEKIKSNKVYFGIFIGIVFLLILIFVMRRR